MSILKYLKQSFSAFSNRFRNWRNPPYGTKHAVGVLPKQLKPRILYIVGEDGFTEHAAMICPCGCNKILYMNLLPDERPCWQVTEHPDGTASLHPSVWRQKDCRSHFWFRQGRIQWVNEAQAK